MIQSETRSESTTDADTDVLTATYRLGSVDAAGAQEKALAMAREQTLEVPSGAATPEIEEALLGRVLEVEPHPAVAGAWSVRIAYAPALRDGSLTQLLNLAFGNISLMEEVLLEELALPRSVLDRFPGPRHGIAGVRELVGDDRRRPLVSSALKPVGLTVAELADLARTLTRAGVDVIKDDHGLVDQGLSPFRERVRAVSEAVRDENARTGGRTLYFPNVTGPVDALPERVADARAQGCAGVVVCPGLTGLDAVRRIAEGEEGPVIMAHPSHANTAPGARRGIAPALLMGTLWRLAGADCLIYVNARGRFAWPLEVCQAINRRARAPLGSLRPAFPVPAGGIQAAEVDHWFRTYGPDTLLLIGGSVLEADDVEAAARAVVDAAHGAGATTAGGGTEGDR